MTTLNWSLATVADTAQTLLETNPVLLLSQLGVETDSGLFKVGDGTTPWVDLAYALINNQQSVWVGVSTETGNLLARSAEDGGLVLKSSLFMTAAEHITALNSNTLLDAMDATAPLKAAVYRISVLMRSVINALGADYTTLKAANYTGSTVQERIAALADQVTQVQGLIDDNATTSSKTWSSTRISQMITNAVSSAMGSLVGAAPEALDTIYELAAALGENANLVTTISQDLGSTIRFNVVQNLTPEQRQQARANMGAASSTFLGTYDEIGNKTLLQHVTESLGAQAPAETLVAEVVTRLTSLDLRTATARCSMAKTNYDANTGQYTTVEWKRLDLTLAVRSVMSAANADGLYAKRTETYYAANGTTVIQTVVYDLVYDAGRSVVSETIYSVT